MVILLLEQKVITEVVLTLIVTVCCLMITFCLYSFTILKIMIILQGFSKYEKNSSGSK
jgi:hypothetical protein